MPFYLSDVNQKIQLATEIQQNYTIHLNDYNEGLIKSKWHTLLKVICWLIYFIASAKIYTQLRKKNKHSCCY